MTPFGPHREEQKAIHIWSFPDDVSGQSYVEASPAETQPTQNSWTGVDWNTERVSKAYANALAFAKQMAKQGTGCIINISSMAAQLPLTRVVGYSASKAAIDNFTRWMAVELATKYGEGIRVNAIAPGFFIAEQNRTLLLNPDNSLTARGETIISQTPMKRFGKAEELISTILWLCDDHSSFVTGVVVPVDGGFSAFSGV